MKHLHFFIALLLFLSLGCTKIEKLEANNQEFVETIFQISESITYTIPNSALDFTNVTLGGTTYNLTSFANCADLAVPAILTLGLGELAFTLDYDDFIPTENPNPLAGLLAHQIRPRSLNLELINITDCDFSMLERVTLYFVMDSVSG
ncbi:MAG: hypothetical protein VX888_03385 [Bacteroidota bacterium]|nr:hypothetical protein [Bacteroidota bacterium]